MKSLLGLSFIITLTVTYGQPSTSIEAERICGQITKSLKYLETEKELSGLRITSDKMLRRGFGYSLMDADYVAGKLRVERENIWQQDKDQINGLFKTVSESPNDTVNYELGKCDNLKIRTKRPITVISKGAHTPNGYLQWVTDVKSSAFGSRVSHNEQIRFKGGLTFPRDTKASIRAKCCTLWNNEF